MKQLHKTELIIIILILCTSFASAETHPYLLFRNITNTPGYIYSSIDPWSSMKTSMISDCSSSNMHFCALLYQITGNTAYANTAKNALLSFTRTSGDGYDHGGIQRVREIRKFSFAYDWIQPYLNSSEDTIIRNKLAELADQVYYDLNDGGTTRGYISTVDYHLQAYPQMGIVGLVLNDYDTVLPHGSTPSDWIDVGTNCLFVNDTLHYYSKSMLDFQVDKEGKDLTESYKVYYYDDFYDWFQVYSYYYNRSIFDDYPITQKWIKDELWSSLPNRYSNNWVTSSNFKWKHAQYFLNLMNSEDQKYILKYNTDLGAATTFSGTSTFTISESPGKNDIRYSTYGNYNSLEQINPEWTTKINSTQTAQVFRESWSSSSSWLLFTTWNATIRSNREMAHDDQLSFDYYDKGDYLMPDSGEVRYRTTVSTYGPRTAKGHNTIMISDTAEGNLGGIPKGVTGSLYYPATLSDYLITNQGEFAEAKVSNWDEIEQTNSRGDETSFAEKTSLTNPVSWTRSIFYPSKEYFLVLDFLNSSQERGINNIFHFGSFSHNSSTYSYNATVDGDLEIDGVAVNWETQTFGSEVNITTASGVNWSTTNINSENVQLNLFSIPTSQISVEKYYTRIGGDGIASEVDHPLVRFKLTTDEPLYRITSINTRYLNESAKSFSEVSVSGGSGNALLITDGNVQDSVYLGPGGESVTAGDLVSNARIAFARENNSVFDFFFISDGSVLSYGGVDRFSATQNVVASLKYTGASVSGEIQGIGSYEVIVHTELDPTLTIQYVRFDGWDVPYSYDSGTGVLSATLSGSGDFEVAAGPDLEINDSDVFFLQALWNGSTVELTATVHNVGSDPAGSFWLKYYDGSTIIGEESISSLAAGAEEERTIYWTPTTGGYHTITVTADSEADVDESDEENNAGSITEYVSYNPNLYIVSSNISFSPTTGTIYQPVTITAKVANRGGYTVNATIKCYNGLPSLGNVIGTEVEEVQRESYSTVTYSWTPNASGTNTIYVNVSVNGSGNETDYTYNQAYRSITVSSGPTTTSTTTTTTTTTINRINISMVNSPDAHAYDSSDPLDDVGDGVGGQGSYMFIGEDKVIGTEDDKYRGIAVFNISTLEDSSYSKSLAIYHYGTSGSGWSTINLSLLNLSSSILTASDYDRTPEIENFYQINATSWTDSNDEWIFIDITNQLDTAISNGYSYIGIRFDPQWYYDDGGKDAVYISTTGSEKIYISTNSSVCSLVGDEMPCNTVTLAEVVTAINMWVENDVSLSEVVRTINAWVNS